MEQQDNQVITVMTQNFVGLENAIKNTGKGEPEGISLQDLLATINQYVDSLKEIGQEITVQNELGRQAVFVPFQDDRQWLQAISSLPARIIILIGFPPESKDFKELAHKAWHQHGKLITDESNRGIANDYPQQFLKMYEDRNPRNPKLPSANARISTKPAKRYETFVELVNKGKTIKEISVEMGMSMALTYLFRTQHREQLESDPNLKKGMPAMKFHKS